MRLAILEYFFVGPSVSTTVHGTITMTQAAPAAAASGTVRQPVSPNQVAVGYYRTRRPRRAAFEVDVPAPRPVLGRITSAQAAPDASASGRLVFRGVVAAAAEAPTMVARGRTHAIARVSGGIEMEGPVPVMTAAGAVQDLGPVWAAELEAESTELFLLLES